MIFVTCGSCGKRAGLDEWCRTTLGGDLPKGQFQCPHCNYAFRRVESEHRIIRAGDEAMIVPGKVELRPVDARL